MNRPTDRRDLVIAVALGVATVAWWSTFLSVGFVLTDEGHTNLAGLRILRGERPFADFFLLYFPGYALWLAGAFQLLGEQLLSARIAWCVFAVARTMVAYLVARRLAPRGPALVAALLAMTLVGPPWKVPVAALFLFGLLAALRHFERPGLSSALVAGAVAGFALWFRWDAALATALVTGGLTLAAPGIDRTSARFKEALAFAAGLLSVAGPGCLWIALTPGAFEGVVEHFVFHASSVGDFALPWPSPFPGFADSPADLPEALRRVLYALPVVALLGLPLLRFGPPGGRAVAAAAWTMAAVAYALAVRRPDASHFVQSLPVAFLPFLALRPRGAARWVAIGLVAVGAIGLVAELSIYTSSRRPNASYVFRDFQNVSLARARGMRAHPLEVLELEALVRATEKLTDPDDRVVAMPAAGLVLFVANRMPALRYDALYPQLLDFPGRAEEAKADLRDARLVILGGVEHGFGGPDSPGLRHYASGLLETVDREFRPERRVGRFTLWVPRDDPP